MASRKAVELAEVKDRERERLVSAALRQAKPTILRARAAVVRAYRSGAQDPAGYGVAVLDGIAPLLARSMLAGHLQGVLRARINARRASGTRLSAMREIERILKARLGLSDADLAAMASRYNDAARETIEVLGSQMRGKVGAAISEALAEGFTTQEGTRRVMQALDASGVGVKPHQGEAIYRTQMGTSYTAGQLEANGDEAIDDILWGYEYATVGDDRVRPNHAALDGLRLPKDDPRWQEIMPPNGWNCRCTVIEVYRGERLAEPTELPSVVNIDGESVTPGPDEGWAFNPGQVFGTLGV